MAHGTPASLDEMPGISSWSERTAAVGRAHRGDAALTPSAGARLGGSDGGAGGGAARFGSAPASPSRWACATGGHSSGRARRARARQRGAVVSDPMAPQFSTLSVRIVDAKRTPRCRPACNSTRSPPTTRTRSCSRRSPNACVRPRRARTDRRLHRPQPARADHRGRRRVRGKSRPPRAGLPDRAGVRRFDIAYQSAGRTPEPWIGPDLTELIASRAAAGQRSFLVVPVGFVCDHTEILFDIDVQAARAARDAGATLRRTESLNTSPTFVSALEEIVRARL